MDRIYIRDLALRCIIGIFDFERDNKQDVVINVTLDCEPFTAAAASDSIEDAVDYKSLTKQIINFVEPSEFGLIETMADGIANICLGHSDKVQRATVCVDKPGALRFARSVAVEVVRSRDT